MCLMAPKLVERPAGEGEANIKGKQARKRANRKLKAKRKADQADARNAWKEQAELFSGGDPLPEPKWRGAKRHQRRAMAAIQKLVTAGEEQQTLATAAASSSSTMTAPVAPPIVLKGSALTSVQVQGSRSSSDPPAVLVAAQGDVSTDSDSSSRSNGSLDTSTKYKVEAHEATTPGGERGYSVHEAARPTVAERVVAHTQRIAAVKASIQVVKAQRKQE